MSDRIQKQLQDITLGIEDEVVDLPTELCEEAAEENRFALIGKPLHPKKQNIREMLSALPRLWGVADEVIRRILENITKFNSCFHPKNLSPRFCDVALGP